VAASRRRAEAARARRPLAALERLAADARPDAPAFAARLGRPDVVNVIAECKRRSPSKGLLRAEYEPAAIARAFERAGAAAISVLTEPAFFDGSLSDLERVGRTVSVPILRKDFVVDEYQLVEARAAGASAVLLIAAALDDRCLERLHRAAASLGLASLVEVHERGELDRALEAGAGIIGVNARNLRTLEVSPDLVLALAGSIPSHVIAVAESGIRSAADIRALREAGYDAFLVGERLMRAEDPGDALGELMRETHSGTGAEGGAEERRGWLRADS
jgi:indole-3-glycerol phosphate synthase